MKQSYNSFKRNGFLLIELLLALGVLASVGLMLGLYQAKVRLYRQAAVQMYGAMTVAGDCLEKLQAGLVPPQTNHWRTERYQVDLKIIPQIGYRQALVTVSWPTVFDRNQQITWEGVCL
jgi:Tfp pilus assembly protein PilV